MSNILEQLSEYAAIRTEDAKRVRPLSTLRPEADAAVARRQERAVPSFRDALSRPGLSFICECKKASPSKGLIAPDFPYLEIAKSYEVAGADAISVLTEPKWFLGSGAYLKEIACEIALPCLRKDFTVDEYMVWEAAALGASAVLLICSILDGVRLRDFRQLAESLSMDALVEAHDEHEIEMALDSGAAIIGVNNRNLADFSVDPGNSRRLRALIPEDILFVSESGMTEPADAAAAAAAGADAVLIGEALMRAEDKGALLAQMRKASQHG